MTFTQRVLCFGDSITWGFNPDTQGRFPREQRWPGILHTLLGKQWEVVNEGANDRTIATDDLNEDTTKNGISYLIPYLDAHETFDVLIIMLGTNNLKEKFAYTAEDIAHEMDGFLTRLNTYRAGTRHADMKILLVSPPLTGECGTPSFLEDCFNFPRALDVSRQFAALYHALADKHSCMFVDAAEHTHPSPTDDVHLDANNQTYLAHAIHNALQEITTSLRSSRQRETELSLREKQCDRGNPDIGLSVII